MCIGFIAGAFLQIYKVLVSKTFSKAYVHKEDFFDAGDIGFMVANSWFEAIEGSNQQYGQTESMFDTVSTS